MPTPEQQLSLFSLPPVERSLEESRIQVIQPVSENKDHTIEFIIKNQNNNEVLDLHTLTLVCELEIKDKDGNNITNAAKGPGGDDAKTAKYQVSPINNLLHSMWDKVALYLGNTQITGNESNYPYRAYIENLLTYQEDSQKTQLETACLFYRDDPAGHDQILISTDEAKKGNSMNAGAVRRRYRFFWKAGSTDQTGLVLSDRLHVDMCIQERFLPSNVDVKFKLIRASNPFCLLWDDTGLDAYAPYKLNIKKIYMTARFVKLAPPVMMQLEGQLKKGNRAKYPIRRVEVRTGLIPDGVKNSRLTNFIQGQLPRRVVLAFQPNATYNGTAKKNPLKFNPHNLTQLFVLYGGRQIPEVPYTFDFPNGDYSQGYMSLYIGTGARYKDYGVNISYDDYRTGYCFFVLDFTAEMAGDDSAFTPFKEGQFDIDLTFGSNTLNSLNLICYAEYDNVVEIDANRNIYKNY